MWYNAEQGRYDYPYGSDQVGTGASYNPVESLTPFGECTNLDGGGWGGGPDGFGGVANSVSNWEAVAQGLIDTSSFYVGTSAHYTGGWVDDVV